MGADVNAASAFDRGITPLLCATRYGHLALIEVLIERGADVNGVGPWGISPLMEAAARNKMDAASLLLKRGAHVNYKDEFGRGALMHACQTFQPNMKMVDMLLAHGAAIDAVDRKGMTPFQQAVCSDKIELARMLLQQNASVDYRGDFGRSALIHACMAPRPNMAIIQILMEFGADCNLCCQRGWTSLMYAVSLGHYKVVQFLLAKRADPNVQGTNGQSALMLAARNGNERIMRILLKHRAKLAFRDMYGNDALRDAVYSGNATAVSLLMKYKAHRIKPQYIGSHPVHRRTVLMDAVFFSKSLAVLEALIQGGCKVNECAGSQTALMIAVQREHSAAAQLLVEYGARVDLSDGNGETAVMHALARSDLVMTQALMNFEIQHSKHFLSTMA